MSLVRLWFAYPLALVLLAILPVLALLGLRAMRRRRQALTRLATPLMLRPLMARGNRWGILRGLGRGFGLACLIVGVAGPRWGREWGQSAASGRDVVVLLDVSRSMFADDVAPNRLGRARDALIDLVENGLRERGGHRVALIVFAARPKVVCPLTQDYDHVAEALKTMSLHQPPIEVLPEKPGDSGTRLGLALQAAVQAHDPRFEGHQDILLLSDGDDPASDEAAEREGGVAAAREHRIVVHTVGIGDPANDSPVPFSYKEEVTTRLREGPLREIARLTGGTYTPARRSPLPLGRLFREAIEARPLREQEDDALPVHRQRYDVFLSMALSFLATDLLAGWPWRRRHTEVKGVEA